tara:strand:+ start:81 stop:326 length:246 start_codon:yes stop_codon:yes gene_type:complete
MIKNNLGIIGFVVALIGIAIASTNKYHYNNDLAPLASVSWLIWLSTMIIGAEIKKSNYRKWYIYLISIITCLIIGILILIK